MRRLALCSLRGYPQGSSRCRGFGVERSQRKEISTTIKQCASSGRILDPYIHLDEDPSLFSTEGLKLKASRIRSHGKSMVAAAHIMKYAKGFKAQAFPPVAEALYGQVMEANRLGDTSLLAPACTEGLYQALSTSFLQPSRPAARGVGGGGAYGKRHKGKRRSRPTSGQGSGEGEGGGEERQLERRTVLRLMGFEQRSKVLQIRYAYTTKGGRMTSGPLNNIGWGQVTCQIFSRRRRVLVDSKGEEHEHAFSEETAELTNPTVVVFELDFARVDSGWKVAMMQEVEWTDKDSPPPVHAPA